MANLSDVIYGGGDVMEVQSPEFVFQEDEINEHSLIDIINRTMSVRTDNGTVNGDGTHQVVGPGEQLQIVQVRKFTTGIAVPILYFFLVVFGIAGNAVVIYVSFFVTRASKNAVDIFVGNLAVADLALITTLPFWAVSNLMNGTWAFGDVGCKIMSFLTHVNMFSSIFLITAMAVDRYTVVVKAVKVRAKSLRTVSRTLCSCAVIWMLSFILSLPSAILRQTQELGNNTYCSWVYPENSRKVWWALHILTRNVIGFVIPLTVICRCYSVIVNYVKDRSTSRKIRAAANNKSADEVKEKQSRHVTRLVTAIIMAFVICWLPNQISNFCHSLIHFKAIPVPSTRYAQEVVYLIHVFTTILSFSNSVVNPVIYSTSPSHRMHIKMIFFRVFRCLKSRECSQHYAEYHAVKQGQNVDQLKTTASPTPQDQTSESKDRRNTEVTRLQLPDSPNRRTSSTERMSLSAYSSTDMRRDDEVFYNPPPSVSRLPTGAEEDIEQAHAVPVIVLDEPSSIAPDENRDGNIQPLGDTLDQNHNHTTREYVVLRRGNSATDAPDTLL